MVVGNDEAGNFFIGDTQNGVIRLVDSKNQIITTIAVRPIPKQNKPTRREYQLTSPASAAWTITGRLFVPEWDGELILKGAPH